MASYAWGCCRQDAKTKDGLWDNAAAAAAADDGASSWHHQTFAGVKTSQVSAWAAAVASSS